MTTKKDFTLLAAIVAAMANADAPFLFASTDSLKNLIKDGFVETNPEMKNDKGEVATRATETGTAASAANDAKVATPASPAPELIVGTGFEAPASATRSKPETYKFDALEIGGFIFVPATEAKKNPAKSLASTVSAATKRYATPIEGKTRKDRNGKEVGATQNTRVFAVTPVTGGVAYGSFTAPSDGAVIFRKSDAVADALAAS